MWAVVGNALAARRGQAIVVALVALLACAAAVAASWYAVAASQRVGVAAVEGVPVQERLVSVNAEPGPGQPVLADWVTEVRQQLSPASFVSVVGGFAPAELRKAASGGDPVEVNIAYREHVCDHLVVTGSCPSARDEVVLPQAVADDLGVSAGDELVVEHVRNEGNTATPVTAAVRLVGSYQVVDPGDPFWGAGSQVGLGDGSDTERAAAFAVREAMADYSRVTYTYDLAAVPAAFATADVEELGVTLDAGLGALQRQDYSVTAGGLTELLDRIEQDRQEVATSIGVGLVVLLLFTWFTLVVVLRSTVVQVRGDVGWWRLRGAPPGRGWVVVVGQSAVPLVAGAIIGAIVGLGLGREIAGTIEGDAGLVALLLGLLLVGLAVAGGFVAVVAAQLGILRTPVRDLLRWIPARRRRWRRSLVDLVLVVLAAAAVGQALVVGRDMAGLASLAPGLAVLAIALLAAWAVQPLAAGLAPRALRAGRLAATLIAASMARRPETHRLFALVAVAVALTTTALLSWDSAARTQWQRAALETGADRVITMAAADSAELLAAVRAIDPAGTEAMAVIHRPGSGDQPPILAVDATRLGVIAGWRDDYGGDQDDVAAMLRPVAPEPAVIEADAFELEAAAMDPSGGQVHARVRLRSMDTGRAIDALVGPLSDEPSSYDVDVPGCAGGCRFVGLQLLGGRLSGVAGAETAGGTETADAGPDGLAPPGNESQVELFRLTGVDGAEIEPALFSEPARWRPPVGQRDLGLAITEGDAGLRLTVPGSSSEVPLDRNDWGFVADTPAPLPALVAGWQPDPTQEIRLAPLGRVAVPTEVAGTAGLIPVLGETGAMVDLEYAERLAPFALGGGTPQVWLSASAPSAIVDDLREAGLTPLRQDSLADHLERLAAEGSAVGVRFQTAVALVALLLAGGAVLVHAAHERDGRATELVALRFQGVSPTTARAAGYGSVAAVMGAAGVVGLVAGIVGAAIARILHPGFLDGWTVLPTAALRLVPVGGAAALMVLALGVPALYAGAALVRQTGSTTASRLPLVPPRR